MKQENQIRRSPIPEIEAAAQSEGSPMAARPRAQAADGSGHARAALPVGGQTSALPSTLPPPPPLSQLPESGRNGDHNESRRAQKRPARSAERPSRPKKTRAERYRKSVVQRQDMAGLLATVDPCMTLSDKARPALASVCDGVLTAVMTAVLDSRPAHTRLHPITPTDIAKVVEADPILANFLPAVTAVQPLVRLNPALEAEPDFADVSSSAQNPNSTRTLNRAFW